MKYFKQASVHFLTKELTHEEFDKILNDGECLPVCNDFADWDVDHLEEAIKQFAETINKEASTLKMLADQKETIKRLTKQLTLTNNLIDNVSEEAIELFGESVKNKDWFMVLVSELAPNETLLRELNKED